MYHTNINYYRKRQRLSFSGARISRPAQDFLGPFSASPVTLEHCGLGLEGCIVKLPLDGSFAELPAAVDSRRMALEYCAVMHASLGHAIRRVVCRVVGSIIRSKMDSISSQLGTSSSFYEI